MVAALLGQTGKAMSFVSGRANSHPAAGYRFPGFAQPFEDSEPSADQYSNMMQGLQWMLIQPGDDADGSIVAFPAWPCSCPVHFKLAAPRNTTVEVDYDGNGTVTMLQVSPTARSSSLIFANCVDESISRVKSKTDDIPSASDEPPGSGWRVQLAKTHPGHHLSLPTSKQRQQSRHRYVGSPVCPNSTWAAAVESAGLLSVKLFGAKGDNIHDDAPAVRRAINASLQCGGCVFFPASSGNYQFHTTLVVHGGCFKGGGPTVPQAGADGSSPPQVNIYGPKTGPAIAAIRVGSGLLIQDLTFFGTATAIYVRMNTVYFRHS